MIREKGFKYILKVTTVGVTCFFIVAVLYGIRGIVLNDEMVLVEYVEKFGILANFFFVLLQMLQVVFPIIPGGVTCLVGVLSFGILSGFVYNYVGLVGGSVFAFYLARKYGTNLVYKVFPKKVSDKYLELVDSSKFGKLFFLAIFLPGFPDDLLCYIAGLSKMKFSTFLKIILWGRPLGLVFYSLVFYLF